MKMTQIPPATIHPATSHHPPFFWMKFIREYRSCITDWKGSMVIPRMVFFMAGVVPHSPDGLFPQMRAR